MEKLDKLVSVGVHGIYSMTKEDILDAVDDEKKKEKTWLYKWPLDEEVYGPHSSEDMLRWTSEGYFQPDSKLLVRKVDQTEWVDINNVDFSNVSN